MSVTAPPRPPRPSDPIDRDELEALVKALIEEARQRARRCRQRYLLATTLGLLVALAGYALVVGHDSGADARAVRPDPPKALATGRIVTHNDSLTLFTGEKGAPFARVVTLDAGRSRTVWRCPSSVWCGAPVSFDWAPDGRLLALSMTQLGGTSPYPPGLHIVDVITGRDVRIPAGAPAPTHTPSRAGRAYFLKMQKRLGCWPAFQLDWSPDGTWLAYPCVRRPLSRSFIAVLEVAGTGFKAIPTSRPALWPSWSADGTRIAYSTGLRPDENPSVFVVSLDGSRRKLVARHATAPAWSPDSKTIAYQTRCGVRLVTPGGKDVTPGAAHSPGCHALGLSGPPVWSPDGKKIAVELSHRRPQPTDGVYVMDANGENLRRVSARSAMTWYWKVPGRPSWRPVG